jgi:DNA-binding NarL/FixJ family response regulator
VEEQLSSSIRILIADDFRGWRLQNRLLLQARPEWQVIAEASDGLEAVQKAEELKPDLILLDIGLPKLNGIEAALRIRQLSPSSKILFLSLQNSLDVVQAALSTGARGYVHKTDAQSELLSAVDAVLRGQQYVSSSLRGSGFTNTSSENTSSEKAPNRHEVLFYSDDAVFLDTFARFIAVALKAGDTAIVVATKSHRDSLLQKLKIECVDVDTAIQRGTYISLDAADSLSTFMVNDMPDAARFFEVVSALIEPAAKAAKRGHTRVVACGECSPLLWMQGKPDAAIRVERLWDDIGTTFEMDILCAYPLSNFQGEDDGRDFQSICAEHTAVHSH